MKENKCISCVDSNNKSISLNIVGRCPQKGECYYDDSTTNYQCPINYTIKYIDPENKFGDLAYILAIVIPVSIGGILTLFWWKNQTPSVIEGNNSARSLALRVNPLFGRNAVPTIAVQNPSGNVNLGYELNAYGNRVRGGGKRIKLKK